MLGWGQPHAKCSAWLIACALSQEVAAKQSSWLCWWRGGAAPKVGALEAAAGGGAGEESKAVAVDLGKAFLHAFIIPNYKARTLRDIREVQACVRHMRAAVRSGGHAHDAEVLFLITEAWHMAD